ncbi:MAG TPA: tripartite tricarboxylate transporter substrate-binding protein, partial [Burkholderiales bacterium]|nr:tripartite tricarboxylate transporter substrate-binding protein [Burkholderiales bacterium]
MYRHIAAALAALLTAGAVHPAQQEFPSKPVRLIVPFPAGGGVDIVARSLAPHLTERWGQQVVIDNRPGAGTTLGADLAAHA